MTAIARAARALARAVDEPVVADRDIRRFVDLVGGSLERIALDGAGENFAESSRAGISLEAARASSGCACRGST
jgi:hypothetical protein